MSCSPRELLEDIFYIIYVHKYPLFIKKNLLIISDGKNWGAILSQNSWLRVVSLAVTSLAWWIGHDAGQDLVILLLSMVHCWWKIVSHLVSHGEIIVLLLTNDLINFPTNLERPMEFKVWCYYLELNQNFHIWSLWFTCTLYYDRSASFLYDFFLDIAYMATHNLDSTINFLLPWLIMGSLVMPWFFWYRLYIDCG